VSIEPTPQQEAIITEMAVGSENTAGIARAGTGKTQTFVFGSEQVPKDQLVVACCFNKTIQLVMEKKFPDDWWCKTQHALGRAAWAKRSHGNPQVEKKKMFDIIRHLPGADNFNDLAKAVGICKAWGVAPRGALAEPRTLLPDEPETYFDLFDKYSIDTGRHEDPVGAVRGALLRSIEVAWKDEIIDFDDMLYMSVIYDGPYIKADTVLVDEAQDLSPINREQLRMMMRPDSRLIAIGDDRQAIYGFRGADRQSLPKIIEEFGCKILPLTVSFRCPQEVVKHAQEIVPDIEPWDKAPEGEVCTEDRIHLRQFPSGSAILCRNNAPIIAACLKFIKNGIGAVCLGRDIASGLITLINKQKATDLPELHHKLWADVDHRADLLEQRDKMQQANTLRDKAECITHLIHFMGKTATVWQLKERINKMFSEEKGLITLSTIHKAKGMEWPTVYILDSDLMPSKYARGEEELEQEHNLMYVARTRAQKRLVYIKSEGIE